jgi:hypothetical protein
MKMMKFEGCSLQGISLTVSIHRYSFSSSAFICVICG